MTRWELVLDEIEHDESMLAHWSKYTKRNPYARDITLQECCRTARCIMENMS